MKLNQNSKKLYFFSLVAVTTLIIFISQLNQNSYHLPPLDAPVASSVYPIKAYNNLKIRKNVVDLTPQEKATFVNALKTLKNTIPQDSQISQYDYYVLQHVLTMGFRHKLEATGPAQGNPAHSQPAFLPWHRQYLYEFEQALQKIAPDVTIPYWDWSDPQALKVILQDDFLGSPGQGKTINIPGVGNFTGGEVTSGIFADWTLNEKIHFDPITMTSLGTKLIRFVGLPPNDRLSLPKAEVEQLFRYDNYEIFNALIEGAMIVNDQGQWEQGWTLHAYAHSVIGGSLVDQIHPKQGVPHQTKILGTMDSIPSSPYDPIFWLNHANVDRLWAEWQDQGHTGESFYPAQGMPWGHNLHDPMWPWDGGLSEPGKYGISDLISLLPQPSSAKVITPADVLDFRNLGYTYDTTQ